MIDHPLLRIYIASWFGSKDRIKVVRDQIHVAGTGEVIGTWLDEEDVAPATVIQPSDITPAQCQTYAYRDLSEVRSADLLILDTTDVNPRGGREVEYGIALGTGVALWIVGPRRNVFHYISQRQFENWTDALAALEDL